MFGLGRHTGVYKERKKKRKEKKRKEKKEESSVEAPILPYDHLANLNARCCPNSHIC
jgi:hypothetical protein